MWCNSKVCKNVHRVVESLVRDRPSLLWTVFDADPQDTGLPPPNGPTVFLRLYPGKGKYVFELILGIPLEKSFEEDIKRFIENNIPRWSVG
jgi:hypothetical protein